MRVAIVSSPRSGNTFVRRTLATALGWPELGYHDFREAPDALPENLFVQIHWQREPEFVAWLAEHRFTVLTVARHPFDVLLSAVRFSARGTSTERWVGGRTGMPVSVGKDGSASPEFIDYCLSDGAEVLLSVSAQWWGAAPLRIRYEQAVQRPAVLARMIARLGGDPRRLGKGLEASSVKTMNAFFPGHTWRAHPGHWRNLIASDDARRIYQRHRTAFRACGYHPPLFHSLSRTAASRNWCNIA
jgi:hypothetical protein